MPAKWFDDGPIFDRQINDILPKVPTPLLIIAIEEPILGVAVLMSSRAEQVMVIRSSRRSDKYYEPIVGLSFTKQSRHARGTCKTVQEGGRKA